MSRSICVAAGLAIIACFSATAPGFAADAGYYIDRGRSVERPYKRHSARRAPRPHVEDFGVFYPYRNYWDRYPYRYYHGRYAYEAEPFPNGFWWW